MLKNSSIQYSPEIEKILNPSGFILKKIFNISIVSIIAVSQQYADFNAYEDDRKQSTLKWHIINEYYRTQLGECWDNNHAYWVSSKNPRILIIENCTHGKVILSGTL